MNVYSNPETVYKPVGAYSQVVRVPGNAEWLVLAGMVGMDRKGRLAKGIGKQAEQTFRNILACLRVNAMSKKDLVKFVIYLTDARFIAEYRAARKKVIGDDALPASTLLIVQGLASPDMCIEIDAWAAKG